MAHVRLGEEQKTQLNWIIAYLTGFLIIAVGTFFMGRAFIHWLRMHEVITHRFIFWWRDARVIFELRTACSICSCA